jgi:quercetin dioxygenase-like cupin family protein
MSQPTSMSQPTGDAKSDALAEGELIVFDLPALAEFTDPGLSVRVLSDVGASRVVLFSFRAGQRLREHHTSSPILVQVVSGTIAFEARGHAIEVAAGGLLQLERNVPHTVVAVTDAIVLVTMTPSPRRHSLSAEVFDKLTPLVTRPKTPRP